MSVRKRKWVTRNGEAREVWIFDYRDQDGKRHIESFRQKKAAIARAEAVGVDMRAGTHTPISKSIIVAEAAEAWIAGVEAEGRERATVNQYRQHARVHILPRIGGVKLAHLSTKSVNAFRDELLRDLSFAMAKKVVVSLKSLLRDAQRRGSVAQNVALSLKPISSSGRDRHHVQQGKDYPTPSEIKAFIDALQGRWRPFFIVATFTGLRSSELRGLPWSAIDFEKRELHVRQRADRYQAIGSPKSRKGHRAVPLGPFVLNALREWRLVCPRDAHGIGGKHGLVFPTPRAIDVEQYKQVASAFVATVKRAGLVNEDGEPKYSGIHVLRHFYASWCINPKELGGLALAAKVVQERLGHSSIVMTLDRYGHLFPRGDDQGELAAAEKSLLG
jgi:integrase